MTEELLRGGRTGADHLLSLKESTLAVADEVGSIPVLILEEPGDLASLGRAIDALSARGRGFIADSVLDPIHFGLSRSLTPRPGTGYRPQSPRQRTGTARTERISPAADHFQTAQSPPGPYDDTLPVDNSH